MDRIFHEVRKEIQILKKDPSLRFRRKTFKVLDKKEVRTYLDGLHAKYVITPTDKAGNNFSIVCKKFYIQCLLKELNISEDLKKTQSTYKSLKITPSRVVQRHIKYMSEHNIEVDDFQKRLPFLGFLRCTKILRNRGIAATFLLNQTLI